MASFIGADGTNADDSTAAACRSRSSRATSARPSAAEIIARLQPKLAERRRASRSTSRRCRISRSTAGSAARSSSTRWKTPTRTSSASGRRACSRRCSKLPELTDVASDQQSGGLQLALTIDRDTAARLGVAPQAIDDTLYDAFGQRQISTIFTQLNLYRVILEVKPELAERPDGARQIYVRSQPASRCRSARSCACRRRRRRSSITIRASSRR